MYFTPYAACIPVCVIRWEILILGPSIKRLAESYPFCATADHSHDPAGPCLLLQVKDALHISVRAAASHLPICHLANPADALVPLHTASPWDSVRKRGVPHAATANKRCTPRHTESICCLQSHGFPRGMLRLCTLPAPRRDSSVPRLQLKHLPHAA